MYLSEAYKNRLSQLSGIIKESEQLDYITIPKGRRLFHGTGEDFISKDARPGGYDNVFWTTEYPAISQSYIPVAGMTSFMSTEHISKPSTRPDVISLQKKFGIVYSNVEGSSFQVESYREAPVFSEISDKHYESWSTYNKLAKSSEDFKKDLEAKWTNLSKEEKREAIRRENELQGEAEQAKEDYFKYNVQKYKNEYVNKKLMEFGYEPSSVDSYSLNHSWRLKTTYKDEEMVILPAEYRHQGRLLIITPKEDLKIYDYTFGETKEASLLNPDYHNITLFRKVEESGYDGIKIPDHAQIESEGNFGHSSIGLFRKTLQKIDVVEIPAVHPKDFGEKHFMTNDYDTDEYKSWKK